MSFAKARPATLETAVASVEQRLAALHAALLRHEPVAIERQADELQRALAQASSSFGAAARGGQVPAPVQQRLAQASAQVASQRESLVRASAALDRALMALLPGQGPVLYGADGTAAPRSCLGPQGLDA